MSGERIYAAIDLKSFYASAECRERGLDPLCTNLVVADESRTAKTICLAVTPSLKSFGISGRARLFEVIQRVAEVNQLRRHALKGRDFTGSSVNAEELRADGTLKLDYIIARPRMALYVDYSTRIYRIYLRHVAPEDIHVYSVDEVMIDLTDYLRPSGMTAREFVRAMIREVYEETRITATAGIGPNLYLCKIAMDIEAKHIDPDEDGVRIAELTVDSYRRKLWTHEPLTDFWRIGRGYAKKLKSHGMATMGDVARCSLENEELLYRLFGINAELLIDHAWGIEPCTMADIKAYRPETHSISTGQVLEMPYDGEKTRLIVHEMTDSLVLDLVKKKLTTDQIVLTVCYDIENFTDPDRRKRYQGEIETDRYGRQVPKSAHGSENLPMRTSSTRVITDAALALYDRIIDRSLLCRRIYVVANHVLPEGEPPKEEEYRQLDLFTDYGAELRRREEEKKALEKERRVQEAVLDIQKRYGKNAIVKGMNLEEGAMAMKRNRQIGGHRA